jgi:hypothetical protein
VVTKVKLRQFKKRIQAETKQIVPNILDKVKPSAGFNAGYKKNVEIIQPPVKRWNLTNKRFVMQFASAILIMTLSTGIILGSLQSTEAVMSKEEFEETMTDIVNVQIDLWDYLPTALSPKQDSLPVGLPLDLRFVNKPVIEPNERITSRQLAYFQDALGLLDNEITKISDLYENKEALKVLATNQFTRSRGKKEFAFTLNDRQFEVEIESKNEIRFKATLPYASYSLKMKRVGEEVSYQGTIAFGQGQEINFKLAHDKQEILYAGPSFSRLITFERGDQGIIGKFVDYSLPNGVTNVINKGIILVDDVNTYVLTDFPLVEEQFDVNVYEIEVYNNDTGNFMFSKIVIGEQEIYRYDLDYLAGFDEIIHYQIGFGVNQRNIYRIDGVNFEETSDYALVQRSIIIREIGNSRFIQSRVVRITYLLVLKDYNETTGLPSPFTYNENFFESMKNSIELLDDEYVAFQEDTEDFSGPLTL